MSALSYLLAMLAAVSNAASNVLQRKANREEPPDKSLSPQLLLDLLHKKVWLAGLGVIIASFLLQAGALATGELAGVQPIIILELPLTLIAARFFLGAELHKQEWFAIILLTGGLGGLVGFLGPQRGASNTSTVSWALGAGGTALIIGILVIAGRSQQREVRGGLFGAAAGVTFGLVAAFIKATTALLSAGILAVLESWELYALIVGGALGMFLVQNALQAGELVAAQPGISLLDPFTAIAWGVFAFHERTNSGIFLVIAGISAALMTLGAVLLSRSPVLQRGQEGEQSEPRDRSKHGKRSGRGKCVAHAGASA